MAKARFLSKLPPERAGSDAPRMEDRSMARIHLVVGPVAAGKSTFALELGLAHRAVRINLDEWMTELFRPDRREADVLKWYVERAARCIEVIWRQAARTLDAGTDVVLEIGLILRQDRARFYERVQGGGYEMTVYVLDAPRDVRRERVLRRNQERGETFSMEVPLPFFELASDMWQPLDEAECSGRDVRFPGHGQFTSLPRRAEVRPR
jgi:predicted kinase